MTDTPLWSNERLRKEYYSTADGYSVLKRVRDDYEIRIAAAMQNGDDCRELLLSANELLATANQRATDWQFAAESGKTLIDLQAARIAELEAQLADERAKSNRLFQQGADHYYHVQSLEAQLAAQWVPLPDGNYGAYQIDKDGSGLWVNTEFQYVTLPPDERLCRQAQAQEGSDVHPHSNM